MTLVSEQYELHHTAIERRWKAQRQNEFKSLRGVIYMELSGLALLLLAILVRPPGSGWLALPIAFGSTWLLISAHLSQRVYQNDRLLTLLLTLSTEVESLKRRPHAVAQQDLVMKRLEAIARLVERYPRIYRNGKDQSTRLTLDAIALGVASQFREYKLWIALPTPTSFR